MAITLVPAGFVRRNRFHVAREMVRLCLCYYHRTIVKSSRQPLRNDTRGIMDAIAKNQERNMASRDGIKQWSLRKPNRDFYNKICFDEIKNSLRKQYDTLATMLST